MKLFDWHKLLAEQQRASGKVLYTVTELAHLSGCSHAVLNVELSRLVKQKVLLRYGRGVYGLPETVQIPELLSYLDSRAYITGGFALAGYNLVTQYVNRIICFTDRRHNRSRLRHTPLGCYEFVTVGSPVYRYPASRGTADPEQAFLDFLYLSRRRGLNAQSLVSFHNLSSLNREKLRRLSANYPLSVMQESDNLLYSLGQAK
ncbi:MAG: hypothetical protein HQK83_12295 [Fibrobacteria bacterium]|nr:hypothetical protein [Fibrobacteria bacterium]